MKQHLDKSVHDHMQLLFKNTKELEKAHSQTKKELEDANQRLVKTTLVLKEFNDLLNQTRRELEATRAELAQFKRDSGDKKVYVGPPPVSTPRTERRNHEKSPRSSPEPKKSPRHSPEPRFGTKSPEPKSPERTSPVPSSPERKSPSPTGILTPKAERKMSPPGNEKKVQFKKNVSPFVKPADDPVVTAPLKSPVKPAEPPVPVVTATLKSPVKPADPPVHISRTEIVINQVKSPTKRNPSPVLVERSDSSISSSSSSSNGSNPPMGSPQRPISPEAPTRKPLPPSPPPQQQQIITTAIIADPARELPEEPKNQQPVHQPSGQYQQVPVNQYATLPYQQQPQQPGELTLKKRQALIKPIITRPFPQLNAIVDAMNNSPINDYPNHYHAMMSTMEPDRFYVVNGDLLIKINTFGALRPYAVIYVQPWEERRRNVFHDMRLNKRTKHHSERVCIEANSQIGIVKLLVNCSLNDTIVSVLCTQQNTSFLPAFVETMGWGFNVPAGLHRNAFFYQEHILIRLRQRMPEMREGMQIPPGM